jgi:phage baseplate assembly protein W
MSKSPVYEMAISLPFKIDNFGGVSVTMSQEKIWADRVRSAIGTQLKERVFRADYGTTIPETLFEDTELMISTIEEEVERAFIEYLPTLQLDVVEATYDRSQDTVFAEVGYFLPNKDQTSVVIGIARLSTTRPIDEELL